MYNRVHKYNSSFLKIKEKMTYMLITLILKKVTLIVLTQDTPKNGHCREKKNKKRERRRNDHQSHIETPFQPHVIWDDRLDKTNPTVSRTKTFRDGRPLYAPPNCK